MINAIVSVGEIISGYPVLSCCMLHIRVSKIRAILSSLYCYIYGVKSKYTGFYGTTVKKMTIPKICEYIFEDLARWPRGDFFSRKIFWGLVKLS